MLHISAAAVSRQQFNLPFKALMFLILEVINIKFIIDLFYDVAVETSYLFCISFLIKRF